MLLANMMENNQLNLSRPLLSVRHRASTVAPDKDNSRNSKSFIPSIPRPPPYKSELKSGPVRNPGKVPFLWEQSPGRSKYEWTPENHIEGPPVAPKLPPGRTLIANQQDNGNVSATTIVNKSQVGNPNASLDVSHSDECGRGIECSEDIVEKAKEEKAESGDEDEVYEDALDTLSTTESFFLNCSVSGISGLDNSDVKPSGTSLTDPQAKEFMIGRFLPAAKAVVLETPQYAPSKKQPPVEDRPRQLKKVVNGDKQPRLRYGPSFARHYSEMQYTVEEESDDEYDENENFHNKACGLLPKFCFKSSLCLLNPLPGMSVRTRPAMSPATRVQARSSSASTCSKTENELSSFDASEQRSIDGSQTAEPLEDKNDGKNKSNEISSKSQNLEGLSTYKHGGLSGHCNAIPVEAKDGRDDGFSSQRKGYRSFRDLLADQSISEEGNSGGPTVEKTLYIDIVHKSEQKTCSFNSKELTNLGANDDDVPRKLVETNLSEDFSLVKNLRNVEGGDILKINFQKPLDFSLPPLVYEPSQKIENDATKSFGEDENLYKYTDDSEILEVPVKQATQSLGKQTPKAEKVGNFHGIYPECPVPPPLPKSPSDSWLCRTLPSMSLKNSSVHSHFGTGTNLTIQASKAQSCDPKWETIVRTTKVHHQHLRYSEELLTPIPES